MTHASLFSGIGGLDLAAEWAGFETVFQCEFADYPYKVLQKHWKDVPKERDIHNVTADSFYRATGLRTVDVISGGFPCQPFSVAGKRRGKEDDRYLWGEMLRVVSEIRPNWVVGENVAGIITMALDQVLSDLESIGYTVQTFVIPACGVDAPHRRNRVFIVAHSESTGQQGGIIRQGEKQPGRSGTRNVPISNTDNRSGIVRGNGELSTASKVERPGSYHRGRTEEYEPGQRWTPEPELGRVANGVPDRVDRLKCLGNAVVPQQAYPIFKAIYDIEAAQRLE